MSCDVVDLRDFYATNLGKLVYSQVLGLIQQVWPSLPPGPFVALGYGVPYMNGLGQKDMFAFMPSYQGVLAWPHESPPLSVLVEEDQLPVSDRSIQNLLMMHFLENCHNPKRVLEEASRVLVNDGRILLIVPNRRGAWARVDQTPFGHGQPYTMTQACLLLRNNGFTPIRMLRGLYTLPSHNRLLQATSPLLERLGPCALQKFSGIVCIEATKEIYANVPARSKSRGLRVLERAKPA
jgi:SAM-dependent methyltransferase